MLNDTFSSRFVIPSDFDYKKKKIYFIRNIVNFIKLCYFILKINIFFLNYLLLEFDIKAKIIATDPRYIIKEKPNEIPKMPMAESLACGTFAGFLVILPLQLWP